MELKYQNIVLRDMEERDIGDEIRWNTTQTQWALWDAPWEMEEELKTFDPEAHRKKELEWLVKPKPDPPLPGDRHLGRRAPGRGKLLLHRRGLQLAGEGPGDGGGAPKGPLGGGAGHLRTGLLERRLGCPGAGGLPPLPPGRGLYRAVHPDLVGQCAHDRPGGKAGLPGVPPQGGYPAGAGGDLRWAHLPAGPGRL